MKGYRSSVRFDLLGYLNLIDNYEIIKNSTREEIEAILLKEREIGITELKNIFKMRNYDSFMILVQSNFETYDNSFNELMNYLSPYMRPLQKWRIYDNNGYYDSKNVDN